MRAHHRLVVVAFVLLGCRGTPTGAVDGGAPGDATVGTDSRFDPGAEDTGPELADAAAQDGGSARDGGGPVVRDSGVSGPDGGATVPTSMSELCSETVTEADIVAWFGLSSTNAVVDDAAIDHFFRQRLRVSAQDVDVVVRSAWRVRPDGSVEGTAPNCGSTAMFGTDEGRAAVAAVRPGYCAGGWRVRDYLEYVRAAFGTVFRDAAASDVKMVDFVIHMLSLMNPVFNTRIPGTMDVQPRNVFSIHRESIANAAFFANLRALHGGAPGSPLAESEPTCAELESMFGGPAPDDAGQRFQTWTTANGWPLVLSRHMNNLWSGYPGAESQYSMRGFQEGQVPCTNEPYCCAPGMRTCSNVFYSADAFMLARLQRAEAQFGSVDPARSPMGCAKLRQLILRTVRPPAAACCSDATCATLDATCDEASLTSARVTHQDVLEMMIAFGNATINSPLDTYTDTVHPADLSALLEAMRRGELETSAELAHHSRVFDWACAQGR